MEIIIWALVILYIIPAMFPKKCFIYFEKNKIPTLILTHPLSKIKGFMFESNQNIAMLFVMSKKTNKFHMKNVKFKIYGIGLDKNFKIIDIVPMYPGKKDYAIKGYYVLEIPHYLWVKYNLAKYITIGENLKPLCGKSNA